MKNGRVDPGIGAASPCPFCSRYPYGFDVRLDLERAVPPEIGRFKILVVFGSGNRLLECPDCGTIFLQRRLIDNEPGASTDTLEFEVLPRAKAEDLLAWAEKEGLEVGRGG